MSLTVSAGSDPYLRALLADHPDVILEPEPNKGALVFQQGPWTREVRAGDLRVEIGGLVELMDNNPMVCADAVSVPSVAGTMALIALGPLLRAGLAVEDPTFQINVEAEEEDVAGWLATVGHTGSVTLATEPLSGEIVAAAGMAKIVTPERIDDLDDLYEEAFGRSFFVRRDESDFDPESLVGSPEARFRLRFSEGEEHSLLAVVVYAWRHGKCGAAQIVHAMNVMAGIEESVGISNPAMIG